MQTVNPRQTDIENATMTDIARMSPAQAQVIIQRLKAERNILRTLCQCLISLHFKQTNERQRSGLVHLIRVQAAMVGIEVPDNE